MKSSIERLAVILNSGDTIDTAIRRMAEQSREVAYAGLAVVLQNDRVIGVVTDGDIRRAYAADADWAGPVTEIMSENPITLSADIKTEDMVSEVYRKVHGAPHLKADSVRYILVTDTDGRLVAIHDFIELLQDQDKRHRNVVVFGLGYVGLTLAVSLANQGHIVTGVDTDPDVIRTLGRGETHIHEDGLAEMLRVVQRSGNFEVREELDPHHRGIYVISVGTPLDPDDRPDFAALEAVTTVIGRRLQQGDQVMLRSTVPSGTTRDFVAPMLERESGLVAGRDFHLAFTPERTLAGRALVELRSLPQVVGGLTASCTNKATAFWSSLTPSIVQVSSPEAAEIVKLANNTFRDISFAFANELAFLSDQYNLDASEVIGAANHGYTRNPIPRPSPGVGGYCLTKDPLLLSASFDAGRPGQILGRIGREVNTRAGDYPVQMVERFAARQGRQVSELNILIVGLAFKGEPETNDTRGSVSIDVGRSLQTHGANVAAWDAVIGPEEVSGYAFEPVPDIDRAVDEADAILILNNHRLNRLAALTENGAKNREKLIFDGWSMLDRAEIESSPMRLYATMGYMTPAKG